MERELIASLEKEGYITDCPEGQLLKATSYKTIELTETVLRDFLQRNAYPPFVEHSDQRDDAVIFYRFLKAYEFTPFDLLSCLRSAFREAEATKSNTVQLVLGARIFGNQLYSYIPFETERWIVDPEFNNPAHLVSFAIFQLNIEYDECSKDNVEAVISFLDDMLQGTAPKYHDITRVNLMENRAVAFDYLRDNHLEIPFEETERYKREIIALAEKGVYEAVRRIGYEYYEGTNGFPVDYKKALFWLEKAYRMKEDPDLARTLGYIFYYGRTTNGVTQGDKAFQYFAIGHFAGGYFEATYKLADCYMHGYGTPINHQAAYNLVDSIYGTTLSHYLGGEDFGKFADVALRMASYRRDGVGCEADKLGALVLFLQARAAIKTRLEAGEYLGDRGVALGIDRSIRTLSKELELKGERVTEVNGYLLPDGGVTYQYLQIDFKEQEDTWLQVTLRDEQKGAFLLIVNPYLRFAERTEEATFLAQFKTVEQRSEFVKHKSDNIDLFGDGIAEEDEDGRHYFDILKLVYVPKTVFDLEKRFTILSVKFDPAQEKTYDYLYEGKREIKIGESVFVHAKGEKKTVTVLDVRQCYEDELPLPYKKMGKAF